MGVNLVEIVRIRISIAIFTAKEWQNLYFPPQFYPSHICIISTCFTIVERSIEPILSKIWMQMVIPLFLPCLTVQLCWLFTTNFGI